MNEALNISSSDVREKALNNISYDDLMPLKTLDNFKQGDILSSDSSKDKTKIIIK